MNLILLSSADFVSGSSRVVLTGRRQAHVRKILKAAPGEILTVGLEGGKMGQARVISSDDRTLEMDVFLNSDPPPKLPLVLCVALMRPIVLKRVLQTLASMGVGEVHFFHSRRVEKSFWQTTALRPETIREELILGLEQARDTVFPEVYLHKRFKPFAEDVLPGLLKGEGGRGRAEGIVADPSGEPMSTFDLQPSTFKILVIGPEGGFIPYEIEGFRKAGCRIFSIGERILKVETAIVALISKIS